MAESRAYKRLKAMHPGAHWQRFESWSGVGVFDANACQDGVEIWVENKEVRPVKRPTPDWIVKAKVRKSQIAWQKQRSESGGRTFVALMLGPSLLVLPGAFILNLHRGVEYEELLMNELNPKEIFKCHPSKKSLSTKKR